ncbi:MAG: hypothetical protein F4Y87_06725 [Synechococcus sp. SB0665_bin_28]|nr:hypothetical protein [Synechococcus sp. SB0665_bin_28]MYF20314.1 hypothetical protein [Synechococcus sp. SB0677_bin_5]
MADNVLLRKRLTIETLFDKLKPGMGLEHTRRRSPINALVHLLSCLAATTLAQTKIKIGTLIRPTVSMFLPPAICGAACCCSWSWQRKLARRMRRFPLP